ncbi:MAG: magnesium transporter MgtE N-terminal domain-containing protein [Thermomicrobiales bacterium]
MTLAASPPVRAVQLYLSRVLGKAVVDTQGERVARVKDVIVHFGEGEHPSISGIVARGGRRDYYIGHRQIAGLGDDGVQLNTFKLDIRPFERRESEALLRRDILDKQLIDIDGRRVIRANDLLLAHVDDGYRLVGVDISPQAIWRRLGPSRLTRGVAGQEIIDWSEVESFATDIPMVRLRAPHSGLARLHPVEIAQIIDDLSLHQGQEILESLDDETAADAMENLDPDDAADLLERLDPERAADILDEMAPDDAADVLAEMSDEDSDELLGLMGTEESEDVRELMEYADDFAEDSAAGLMTTDFVAVAPDVTVETCLAGLRAIPDPPDPLYHLYLVEDVPDEPGKETERQRLLGVVPIRDLLFADAGARLSDLSFPQHQTVPPEESARSVAHMMAEYRLATLPVVDADGCILGVVQIDDAMDVLIPDLWDRALSGRLLH